MTEHKNVVGGGGANFVYKKLLTSACSWFESTKFACEAAVQAWPGDAQQV